MKLKLILLILIFLYLLTSCDNKNLSSQQSESVLSTDIPLKNTYNSNDDISINKTIENTFNTNKLDFLFNYSDEEPNSHANMLNRGFIAKQGDYYFYFKPDGLYARNGIKGEDYFLNSITGKYITISGDFIYFVNEGDSQTFVSNDDDRWSLYRIRLDGTDLSLLSDDILARENKVLDWLPYGLNEDFIFYNTYVRTGINKYTTQMIRMALDGSDRKEYGIQGNYFYSVTEWGDVVIGDESNYLYFEDDLLTPLLLKRSGDICLFIGDDAAIQVSGRQIFATSFTDDSPYTSELLLDEIRYSFRGSYEFLTPNIIGNFDSPDNIIFPVQESGDYNLFPVQESGGYNLGLGTLDSEDNLTFLTKEQMEYIITFYSEIESGWVFFRPTFNSNNIYAINFETNDWAIFYE